MKRLLFFLLLLVTCISYGQAYQNDTSTYGNFMNRIKPKNVLGLPRKASLTTNTNDTTAQIFITNMDSVIIYTNGNYINNSRIPSFQQTTDVGSSSNNLITLTRSTSGSSQLTLTNTAGASTINTHLGSNNNNTYLTNNWWLNGVNNIYDDTTKPSATIIISGGSFQFQTAGANKVPVTRFSIGQDSVVKVPGTVGFGVFLNGAQPGDSLAAPQTGSMFDIRRDTAFSPNAFIRFRVKGFNHGMVVQDILDAVGGIQNNGNVPNIGGLRIYGFSNQTQGLRNIAFSVIGVSAQNALAEAPYTIQSFKRDLANPIENAGVFGINENILSLMNATGNVGVWKGSGKYISYGGAEFKDTVRIYSNLSDTTEGTDIIYQSSGHISYFDSRYNAVNSVTKFRARTNGTPLDVITYTGAGVVSVPNLINGTVVANGSGVLSVIPTTTGTVTAITVTGANGIGVTGSPITSSGTIALLLGQITPTSVSSSGAITGTTLAGTILTAAQPNITSLGILNSLTVSGVTSLTSFGTGLVHSSVAGLLSSSLLVNADITNSTIDLTSKVTGLLPSTNGGSGVNNAGPLIWGAGGTLGTNAYNSTAFLPLTAGSGQAVTGQLWVQNTSQPLIMLNYTGAGTVLRTSISTYSNTFNIYDETSARSVINYNPTANTITLNQPTTAISFIKSGAVATNILLAGGTDIAQGTFILNQTTTQSNANFNISGTSTGTISNNSNIASSGINSFVSINNANDIGTALTSGSVVSGSYGELDYTSTASRTIGASNVNSAGLFLAKPTISGSSTITMTQATGIRAMSALTGLFYIPSTAASTSIITHAAGLRSYLYADNTANLYSITNYYGVLIGSSTEFMPTNITNRYGIYQEGVSDKNYLAGPITMPTGSATSRAGSATLVSGTVTVSNTSVTANTIVMLTRKTSGGTIGTAITYTVSAGTSFTINSDNVLDTSTFSWFLIN